MTEIKNSFNGGLDLDSAYYLLGKDCYVDALNITRDAVSANQDSIVSNIIGNRIFDYTLPSGTNVCIGAYANTLRNTVISFVYNSNSYHSIIQYDFTTRTSTKIFENLTDSGSVDILGFTVTGKITGINVYNRYEGDLLFFLDSLGRPSALTIDRFIAGEYTPVSRDIINLAKRPPLSNTLSNYGNDTTRVTNYFQKKLTRYKYRWVYDDDYKSTYSPIGVIPLPVNALDPEYTNVITNNNVVNLSMNSGPKNVKAVEICVSVAESSNIFARFQLVQTINKSDEVIDDNIDFAIQFYNDSTYPYISDDESLLLFDYVPDYAVAQDTPNGNVLAYGNITEGYPKDLTPNVTIAIDTVQAGNPGTIGSLNGVPTITDLVFAQRASIEFSGVPAAGTIVNVYLITNPGGVQTLVATYTTVSGDLANDVVTGLGISATSIGIATNISATGNTLVFLFSNSYDFDSLSITPPSASTSANSVATWKWSTSRHIGISYYDQNGKTNGILYNASISFPKYAESAGIPLIPFLDVKIYHVPPSWAYSYQISFTKEPTKYLFFETVDILYLDSIDTRYTYFDITNLALNQEKNPTTAAVVSWSFQDGDRIRVIKDLVTGSVYDSENYDSGIEGIVTSPTINNVTYNDRTFVKVKKTTNFSTGSFANKYFVIELYRPGQQPPTETNEVYYECGIEYPILDPGTATRRHAGQITDQSSDYVTPAEIEIYNGDSYFRSRTVVLGESGVGVFNVQDRNFVDFFISAVSSIDGRPLTIEINARTENYGALIRHSEAYQPNTNINGLNRFYPNNFLDCDYSFGGIIRLLVRDRLMKVFQQNKIGRVPLFNQISKDQAGNTVQVVTDQLLNPIQYYVGNWGIGTAGTSLASFNYADYFVDNIRGALIRSSLDGLTPISLIFKVNSWATDNLPLRVNPYFCYGAYDQKLNNYIIALEATDTSDAQTLTFEEEGDTNGRPTFGSFLSLQPEMMCTIGNVLISFKNGALWSHDSTRYNSFFGIDYESSLTAVFNENPNIGKTYQAVEEIASGIWDCPVIISQTKTYGSTQQQTSLISQEFDGLEGKYAASIKRDSNSRGGKINGDIMKGNWLRVKFRKQDASDLVTLDIVQVNSVQSPLNKIN